MSVRFSFFHTLPAFLLLLVSGGYPLFIDSVPVSAAEVTHPENTINITFDLARRSMTGTSRITLPPDTPLTLFCGQLAVTGALLEKEGQTPLSLQPSPDNIINIPAADVAQTIFISWSLAVPKNKPGDNLIDPAGITLAGIWHPVPDIDMVYSLEAQLPENFTGISEGETLSYCKDASDTRYLSSSFAYPLRAIHFVAGPYTVTYKKMGNGVTLAAFFFPEDLNLADAYLEKTAAYITRYEKLIGPYPYSQYSIVENRLPTGYGMPTFTLLGQAVIRLPFIKDTSLGHEVLHSWFGNSVHTDESSGNWAEGLTTYLADQLYAKERGEGAAYRKNQLLRYDSYVHADNGMSLAQFSNASDSQPMARQIRAIGYDKSSMVFHMLRKRLGDKLFFTGLQDFYTSNKYKRASWQDLESSFTNVSGEDLALFFEQWLTWTDIPKLVIKAVDVSQKDGSSVITFTVKQASVEPFELNVPVSVKTRTAESLQMLRLSERSQELKITVDNLPLEMTIDPDYDLLRVLRPREKEPTWSRLMGAENKTVVLPPEDNKEIYAALLPILDNMGFTTLEQDELTSEALSEGSYLFLGNSPQSLGLFADPGHAQNGFTLDVRKNPLATDRVMGFVTSFSEQETAAAARKLRHYGKYSFLFFQNGRVLDKRIVPADQGIHIELFQTPKGIKTTDVRTFDDIISELQKARVVYVGETHTAMGDHILQLQIIQALYENNPDLVIGLEMFPRSSQNALDDYINGTIETEKDFLKQSNYFAVWGYDYRLYSEIIGYARKNHIPLLGINIDKAIVSKVFKDGHFDGLDEEQIETVPTERKLDIPGYRDRLARAYSSHESKRFDGDNLSGFMQAQSIWDEAMAETIVGYLSANPNKQMVVIAGNGHTYKDTGIPSRVQRRLDIVQSVVSSTNQGMTGQETGYQVDYLLYTLPITLKPAPKIGVVLSKEKISEDDEQTRLRIMQVSPHGKAGEAGIEENDIILTIDDQEVHDINDVKISLLDKQQGDKVTVRVLREHVLMPDKELDIEVELSTPMNMGGMPPAHPK